MKGGGINKRLIKIYKRSKYILSVKKIKLVRVGFKPFKYLLDPY